MSDNVSQIGRYSQSASHASNLASLDLTAPQSSTSMDEMCTKWRSSSWLTVDSASGFCHQAKTNLLKLVVSLKIMQNMLIFPKLSKLFEKFTDSTMALVNFLLVCNSIAKSGKEVCISL